MTNFSTAVEKLWKLRRTLFQETIRLPIQVEVIPRLVKDYAALEQYPVKHRKKGIPPKL